jgi:hypothetical protein
MRRLVAQTRFTILLGALFLIPLGGTAAGGSTRAEASGACATETAAVRPAFDLASPICYVDQFGTSYSFHRDTADPEGNYLIGIARDHQGCDSPTWYIEGSFVSQNGLRLQLTVINPLGDGDSRCVGSYTLKGRFPDMAWYYTYGYGQQEFTFVSCADARRPARRITRGGARRN